MDHVVQQLPGGLRLATARMPHMESVAVGLWIGVGGRHEPERVCGISHFIEHMLFKGTRKRSARQISATVEGIGGYINAFTGEESTCYYAKAAHRHLDILLDVLSDMYQHSVFDRVEIDKERQVIKEELLMYRDAPDQHVQEMLIETLWPDHPLGRLLTGTEQSLDVINRTALTNFKRQHYVAPNTVVTLAGPIDHDSVLARISQHLRLPRGGQISRYQPVRIRQRAPRLRYLVRPIEQTHLAIGLRSFSRHDRRRYAQRLLSVILGENMSSRLFQVVRERHGLAYSIQSGTHYFDDTGVFTVSAGIDTSRIPRALALILREMRKMTERQPSEAEVRRAKDYVIGQLRLSLESTVNQMNWLGEHLLAYGKVVPPEVIEQRVEVVTRAEIQSVARDLFRDRHLNAAVISPAEQTPDMVRQFRWE